MEAVGDACEQQGQLETARELYLAAPNPCAALRIMNRQLSDLIKPAIADEAAGMMQHQHAPCILAIEVRDCFDSLCNPCGATYNASLHDIVNPERTGVKSLLFISSTQSTTFSMSFVGQAMPQ